MKKRSKAASAATESTPEELPEECTVAEALITTGTTYEDLEAVAPVTPPPKFARLDTGSQYPPGYFDQDMEAPDTAPDSSSDEHENENGQPAVTDTEPKENPSQSAERPGTPEPKALDKMEEAEEAHEIESEDGKRTSVCCQDIFLFVLQRSKLFETRFHVWQFLLPQDRTHLYYLFEVPENPNISKLFNKLFEQQFHRWQFLFLQDRKPLFPEVPENPHISKLFNQYLRNEMAGKAEPLTDDQMTVVSRLVLQAGQFHVR